MSITKERKYELLRSAVHMIHTHCVETPDCEDCLLLGKNSPHFLASSMAFECPFVILEFPRDWILSMKDADTIFEEIFDPEEVSFYENAIAVKAEELIRTKFGDDPTCSNVTNI